MDSLLADISQNMVYFNLIFDSFMELHGDRKSGDDSSVVGGLARLDDHKLLIISYRTVDTQNNSHSFVPAGYRKSLRLMMLAEDFKKPIINFIDEPIFPSLSIPKQQMLDESIARSVEKMSKLKVPIICVIMGAHKNAKAIDLCAADRVVVMNDESHSDLESLEKVWNVGSGSESLCFNPQQLLDLNIVHRILTASSQEDRASVAIRLKNILLEELEQLIEIDPDILLEKRLERLQNQFSRFNSLRSSSHAADKIS